MSVRTRQWRLLHERSGGGGAHCKAEVPDSAAWVESVMSAQQDAGFVYHGKAMLEVAEPTFVTGHHRSPPISAPPKRWSRRRGRGRLLLDDRDLQNTPSRVARRCSRRRLVLAPSGYRSRSCSGVWTGCARPEGLHFLEFNGAFRAESCPPTAGADPLADTDLARAFGQQHPSAIANRRRGRAGCVDRHVARLRGGGLPYTVVAIPSSLIDIATPRVTYLSAWRRRGVWRSPSPARRPATRDDRLRPRRSGGRRAGARVLHSMLAYLAERLDGIKAALRGQVVGMITSLSGPRAEVAVRHGDRLYCFGVCRFDSYAWRSSTCRGRGWSPTTAVPMTRARRWTCSRARRPAANNWSSSPPTGTAAPGSSWAGCTDDSWAK